MALLSRLLRCLLLLCAARGSQHGDRHPKYALVEGTIETLWQRPRGEPKAIFFVAHGCGHQATDFFAEVGPDGWLFEACSTSNFGKCLALPEEMRLRRAALQRDYLVVAVSARNSCWQPSLDGPRVATAVGYVMRSEGLATSTPIFAMGASSGGFFVAILAQSAYANGALAGLKCIIPQIAALPDDAPFDQGVPTLFVHMPRDAWTNASVQYNLKSLRSAGIRAAEITLAPLPVTIALLQRCVNKSTAEDILMALREGHLLDGSSFLKVDPRKREWVSALSGILSLDMVKADESCISEEMNVAWAYHEFSAQYATDMFDFCEGVENSSIDDGSGESEHDENNDQRSNSLRGESAKRDVNQRHILVIDAGSSGTRMHVFNLLPSNGLEPSEPALLRVDLAARRAQTKRLKPGLSHFGRNGDLRAAEGMVQRLLEFANDIVPPSLRAETRVVLKATAGLRKLPESRAEAVLNMVRVTLGKSGYLFRSEDVSIISGKEEAGLAWVAANYLRGTFDQGIQSIGVIEMGGGSTQVSFQVDPSEVKSDSDHFTFSTPLGTDYHLYAHSYLGYGLDYAQTKLQDLLPSTSGNDPCYPVGYVRSGLNGSVVGSGNSEDCEALIQMRLLSKSIEAPGRYSDELKLRGPFVAIETFFFLRENLHLPLPNNLSMMEAQAKETCGSAIVAADSVAEVRKPNECFGFSYQVMFLRALNVHVFSNVSVEVLHQIQGSDVDWALGVAVLQAFQLPGQQMQAAKDRIAMVVSLILVVVVFFSLRYIYFRFFSDHEISCYSFQQYQAVAAQLPMKIGASKQRKYRPAE